MCLTQPGYSTAGTACSTSFLLFRATLTGVYQLSTVHFHSHEAHAFLAFPPSSATTASPADYIAVKMLSVATDAKASTARSQRKETDKPQSGAQHENGSAATARFGHCVNVVLTVSFHSPGYDVGYLKNGTIEMHDVPDDGCHVALITHGVILKGEGWQQVVMRDDLLVETKLLWTTEKLKVLSQRLFPNASSIIYGDSKCVVYQRVDEGTSGLMIMIMIIRLRLAKKQQKRRACASAAFLQASAYASDAPSAARQLFNWGKEQKDMMRIRDGIISVEEFTKYSDGRSKRVGHANSYLMNISYL
eukprot:gene10300-8226_t